MKHVVTLFLLPAALLLLLHGQLLAGPRLPINKALDGSKNQLQPDSVVLVKDSLLYEASYLSKLESVRVKNKVSFKINEFSPYYLQTPFTASVKVRVTATMANNSTRTIDTVLAINYDTASTYVNKNTYVFDSAYQVEVKVLQFITNVSWNVRQALMIENELETFPVYKFSCSADAIQQINHEDLPANTKADQLAMNWAPVMVADEYDLEWAYIDAGALADSLYGDPNSPNARLIFDNNASRVTIAATSYQIPLLYDDTGTVFFRVRPVQIQGQGRLEGNWSSSVGGGLGRFNYYGHQDSLNWQATTSFAEEGKRKSVVQYYDGSLNNRQTVTKDNSTGTVIVGETLLDYQGRPAIQVMPAPTLGNTIGYHKNFNTGINGSAYEKGRYDTLLNAQSYCGAAAAQMGSTTGAALYYSPSNPLHNDSIHRYIPDANGYPFTQTEYTQDNTGRISAQSGVGGSHQLGSGHETRYYYGTPDQYELDALFGTDAGDHSHYYKTMVRDANGQFSVSYTDMHGRTVATALADTATGARLDKLSSYKKNSVTESLSDPGSVTIKDLVMESKKGLLVSTPGDHTFTYSLDPSSLSIKGCDSTPICYDCLYDLEITISDDCNNQKVDTTGRAFRKVFRNFSLSGIDTACNAPAFQVSFTKYLEAGSYDITKKLSVSRYGMNYYRDSIYLAKNLCKTLESFVQQQRLIFTTNQVCKPSCTSCRTSVGEWSDFRASYMAASDISEGDSASFRGQAWSAYQQALAGCDVLCDSINELDDVRQAMLDDLTSPSGQYANIDSVEDKYSIFYVNVDVPADAVARYRRTSSYLDEKGAPARVYDEVAGIMVRPDELTGEAFSQKFEQSWAEALLPYHPEYCKLNTYESLKASFRWDKRFGSTDTYREAMDKGYLNPTNSTETAFTKYNKAGSTPDRDPLAGLSLSNNVNNFKKKLEDSITRYRKLNSTTYITLWALATLTAATGADSSHAFDSTLICMGDLDMAWRTFRQAYLAAKKDIINHYTDSVCNGSVSLAMLQAAGHQPRFGSQAQWLQAYGLSGLLNTTTADTATKKQASRDSAASLYRSNCLAYVTQWWQQLKPCDLSAADSLIIIPRLVNVCALGSDMNHPFGASSIKPGTTAQYTSFEQVLKFYRDSTGRGYDSACNVYLITAPLPYSNQGAVADGATWTKPDSCQCSSIKAMYNRYQAYKLTSESFSAFLLRTTGTSMSSTALDSLRNLCSGQLTCNYLERPLYIPPVFSCGVKDVCVPCAAVDSLYRQFRSEFTTITPSYDNEDTVQQRRNALFAAYMNNHLGFSKLAPEYLDFMGTCGIALQPSATNCAGLDTLLDNFRQTTAFRMRYVYSFYDTINYPKIRDTRLMFRNGLAQLPDSLRAKPKVFYTSLDASLSGGRFCFMDSGYSIEMRMRMPRNSSNGNTYYLANGSVGAIFLTNDVYDTQGNYRAFSYLNGFCDENYVFYGEYNSGNGGFYRIPVDSTAGFDRFQNFRLKFTRSRYYVYYNDSLVWSVTRPDTTQPIYATYNPTAAFLGNDGAVDWLKVYDKDGRLQFMEDFSDSLRPRQPDPSLVCPAPGDCEVAFTTYFNQSRSTNYSYYQIDSLYRTACGHSPDPCYYSQAFGGPLLCGKNEAVYAQRQLAEIDNCSDSTFFIQSQATELYRAYRDSLSDNFLSQYRNKCMQAYQYESFTVTHQASEFHYTLYYYDQAGNLTRTVPPAGVDMSKWSWALQWRDSVKQAKANQQRLVPDHVLSTNYRYNTLNQVVAQSTPDGGASQFWYDRLGRLVFSQNGRQQAASASETGKKYSYTLYDSIGRITQVGEISNQGTAVMTDSISRNPTLLSGWLSASASAKSQITATVYDTAYAGFSGLNPAPLMQKNLRNRVSYSSYTLGSNPDQYNQATMYSYDIHGNVDTLLQDYGNQSYAAVRNVMNAGSNRFKKLVYGYDLISGKVNWVAYQTHQADQFYHRYLYDAENRLLEAQTSHDSLTWERDAQYSYYRHGPLARTVLGQQYVQGMDYAYTLQGWLKGVNSTGLNSSWDMGGDSKAGSINQLVATDALAFTLNYYGGDYKAIAPGITPFPGYSAYLNQGYRPCTTATYRARQWV